MNISNLRWPLSVAVLLLLATCSLGAQNTEFFVEDATTEAGTEVSVNVRGIRIDKVVGLQLSLAWDTLTLEFLGISDIVLNGTFEENFNRTQLDSGRIGYLEVDGSLMGFGLPDSSLMFTLHFMPLSSVSLETEITFSQAPLRLSASDNDNMTVEPDLNSGTVTIEGSSSVSVFSEDARFSVSPNPLSDFGQVAVRLDYNSKAMFEVLDISGRTLLRRPWAISSGKNTIDLSAADFPAAGTYIVRLTTDREQLHRKVVLHRNGR